MTKLEPWQRYRKASPCPVCGGYGAYKPEHRCVGFLSADGEGAFCSQVADGRSPVWFEALGMDLYFHSFYDLKGFLKIPEGEGESKPKAKRHRILAMADMGAWRRCLRQVEAARRPDWRDYG